jgi:hypothetical protein
MKIKTFSELNEKIGENIFYKIIDKENINTWLNKKFSKDKKTMVTKNRKEIDEINPAKTAVILKNVPNDAIIDSEGNWFVLELFPVKNKIEVEPFK